MQRRAQAIGHTAKSRKGQNHGMAGLSIASAALGVLFLDQVTKKVALELLSPGEPRPVVDDTLRLTLSFDRGHTFGAAAGLSASWWWGIPALAVAGILVCFLVAVGEGAWFGKAGRIATGLILGGATSNLVDHIVGGRVVNFVDIDWLVHWWTFNVADAAMVVGWLLLCRSILSSTLRLRR